jgi:hypothetical protein
VRELAYKLCFLAGHVRLASMHAQQRVRAARTARARRQASVATNESALLRLFV